MRRLTLDSGVQDHSGLRAARRIAAQTAERRQM